MTVLADSPVRALSARPHQEAAISAVADLYRAGAPRVQLRMACGSGKTLTSIWLAQRINARTIAVFAPSIGLVGQTIDAWRATGLKLRTLAVCSDPTTLAGRAEIGVDGIDPYRDHHDQAGAVTTQPAVVARFLDTATDFADHTTVVVSTYHSAGVIAAALRYTDRCRQFDLVIADFSSRIHPVRHVRQHGEMRLCHTPRRYCSRHPMRVTGSGRVEGGGCTRERWSTSSRPRTTRTIRRASRYSTPAPPRSIPAATAG